jgi:hypothetical protein
MDKIVTLRDLQSRGPGLPPVGAREFVALVQAQRRGAFASPIGEAAGPILAPEVNHGRWIVRCPACAGAENADPEEPWFYCLSCCNVAFDGRWLPIQWPPERTAIEVELLKRPLAENRNWLPGESVADLRRENRERGVT